MPEYPHQAVPLKLPVTPLFIEHPELVRVVPVGRGREARCLRFDLQNGRNHL